MAMLSISVGMAGPNIRRNGWTKYPSEWLDQISVGMAGPNRFHFLNVISAHCTQIRMQARHKQTKKNFTIKNCTIHTFKYAKHYKIGLYRKGRKHNLYIRIYLKSSEAP